MLLNIDLVKMLWFSEMHSSFEVNLEREGLLSSSLSLENWAVKSVMR